MDKRDDQPKPGPEARPLRRQRAVPAETPQGAPPPPPSAAPPGYLGQEESARESSGKDAGKRRRTDRRRPGEAGQGPSRKGKRPERAATPHAARSGALRLLAAVREGALLRVRPKAMTVAVILAGLLPILVGTGTGSEVMSRIAAPMIGGMLTAPLLSMFVIPAAYLLLRQRSSQPSIPMKHHERNLQ